MNIVQETFYKGFILTFFRDCDKKKIYNTKNRFNMNDFTDNELGYFNENSKLGKFIYKLTFDEMISLIIVFQDKLKKPKNSSFRTSAKISRFKEMTEEIKTTETSLNFRRVKTVTISNNTSAMTIKEKKEKKKKEEKEKQEKDEKEKKDKEEKEDYLKKSLEYLVQATLNNEKVDPKDLKKIVVAFNNNFNEKKINLENPKKMKLLKILSKCLSPL
jgi:hypothetical protein